MAGVAKWLRQRLVAPLFGGSSPLARPSLSCLTQSLAGAAAFRDDSVRHSVGSARGHRLQQLIGSLTYGINAGQAHLILHGSDGSHRGVAIQA